MFPVVDADPVCVVSRSNQINLYLLTLYSIL